MIMSSFLLYGYILATMADA